VSFVIKVKQSLFIAFLFLVLSYLLIDTGLHGDDYTVIASLNGHSFWSFY